MKISVDNMWKRLIKANVFLDNVKLDMCYEADDKEGYALCYEQESLKKVRYEGNIKIELEWK